MGLRLTVYLLSKADYKRNVGKMREEKFEDLLDRSKQIRINRKGISSVVASHLKLSGGGRKKVSMVQAQGLAKKLMGYFLETCDIITEAENMSIGDVHTLTAIGLAIEAFTSISPSNRLYGGYYVMYG
jgi:hypothetical protein